MAIEITFIVNAGVLIKGENTSILIDSLYRREGMDSFSRPGKELSYDMINGVPPFDNLTAYLFTHLHVDHGSPYVVAALKNKDIPVIFPYASMYKNAYSGIKNPVTMLNYKEKKIQKLSIGDAKIICIPTEHAGSRFYFIEHFSYIIEIDGQNILVCGDVNDEDENLISELSKHKIDAAIVNFSEVARKQGRELISKHISPKVLFLYHLPLPNEDRFGYIEMTNKCLRRYEDELPKKSIVAKYLEKTII